MQQGFKTKQSRDYYKIAHGNICKNVPEGTEGASRVEVKNKTTGEVKIYHEISHTSVAATLENVTFKDDKFGKIWCLYLSVNGKQIVVQVNETSRICADFLKKLPNLKQGEQYTFTPYDFVNEKDKRVVGFSIKNLKGEKIPSFYHLHDEKTKATTPVHGFPAFPEDSSAYTSEDWKVFFGYTIMGKFLRPKSLEFVKNNFKSDFITKDVLNIDRDRLVDDGGLGADIPDFDTDEDIPF